MALGRNPEITLADARATRPSPEGAGQCADPTAERSRRQSSSQPNIPLRRSLIYRLRIREGIRTHATQQRPETAFGEMSIRFSATAL